MSLNMFPLIQSAITVALEPEAGTQGSGNVQTVGFTAGGIGISLSFKPETTAAPLSQDIFNKSLIYGATHVTAPTAPTAAYKLPERMRRIDAYADRVVAAINNIENGSDGERNVKFQQARQFLEPAGYFSGGLLAAGYDPHEKINVTFTSSVRELNGASHVTNQNIRTYFAWEIAAGALAHDKVERGGTVNVQSMHIEPQDRSKVADLESMGNKLQRHWELEISQPMRDTTGALAQRSGKADAYAVRGTLQSLANDKEGFEQLSEAAQTAVGRTLRRNGQVIVPNIYGYPLAGYAFVPFLEFKGNVESRPHKGVMIDLKNGGVTEIWDDRDFAGWAKKNRNHLLRSFNAGDRQGTQDAHWPKAGDVLDNLIAGNHATYPGYRSLVKDEAVPVWETFNYTESRDSGYRLKYGNLDTGIAAHYQEVNAKNAVWSDQTQVFGSSQQNWKAAKDLWGNTFGYLPGVGNAGNIVFGIHDSIYGKTSSDRLGGTAAAVISSLQLAHEVALSEGLRGVANVSEVSAPGKNYTWSPDSSESDLELMRTPSASQNTAEVVVESPPTVNPTTDAPATFAQMREIEFRGQKYFVADTPDGGDGVHYLLRNPDPVDPSKWVSSGIIAKPDEAGVWQLRSVVGGGVESAFIPLEYAQASEALDAVITEQSNAAAPVTQAQRQTFADTLTKLISESNAEDYDEVGEYIDKDSNAINESLRTGERTVELDMFLEEFDELNSFEGKAYRSAFVTPEGAEKIKNGVGQVFKDSGVQSASATVRNATEWESWATEEAEERGNATQQVVYVFDESLPKKNLSTSFLPDHVAVAPGEPMQVLAVQEADNKLFVYLSKPSKVPEYTYSLFDGSSIA
ncbi:hypothetical protein HU759_017770 [Pseudomonas sp. OE 28.3]|uniref:hypothetical protein n=1 Tax=Pseudomonas TaxID=286 RepID=UPI001644D9B2|nr:hypothetical protein [Pseudomonas sp. OE 28.3]QXI56959.1 hypothetical protein HU759_017770 [Pseudomonas sp. OE 28.3]